MGETSTRIDAGRPVLADQTASSPTGGRRGVGRPRQFDDDSERRLILDAAYAVIRDRPADVAIAAVLERAGVSTRAFYRHFESKDSLLREIYLRDARWAAGRLAERLADAATPEIAVEWWIDEIYAFRRDSRRSERVTVLGSIVGHRQEGVESVADAARSLLIESLREAIRRGTMEGRFTTEDVDAAAELIAVATMHAAGIAGPHQSSASIDQATTTAFCLAALTATS